MSRCWVACLAEGLITQIRDGQRAAAYDPSTAHDDHPGRPSGVPEHYRFHLYVLRPRRRAATALTPWTALKTGFWSLPLLDHLVHPDFPLRREKSAMSVGLTTSRRDGSGWTVETQAGLVASHLAADWSTTIWGVRLKFGAAMGTGGTSAFVDGEGRITSNTRLACVVSLEFGGGVTMRWRYVRSETSFMSLLNRDTASPA